MDRLYAVAINAEPGLLLLARIKRAPSGIYYLIYTHKAISRAQDGTAWNPHASYHKSGLHHLKTFGDAILSPTHRQPLGPNFKGTEPLMDQSINASEIARSPQIDAREQYSDVFEIPAFEDPLVGYYQISVHLVGTHEEPVVWELDEVFAEHMFRDASPWIHVRFGRAPHGPLT